MKFAFNWYKEIVINISQLLFAHMRKYKKHIFKSTEEFNQGVPNYDNNYQRKRLMESHDILNENGIKIINFCQTLKKHNLQKDVTTYLVQMLVNYFKINDATIRFIKHSTSSERDLLFTRYAYQYKSPFLFLFKKFVEINSSKINDKEKLLYEVQTAVDSIQQTKIRGVNMQISPIFTDETYSFFQKTSNVFQRNILNPFDESETTENFLPLD